MRQEDEAMQNSRLKHRRTLGPQHHEPTVSVLNYLLLDCYMRKGPFLFCLSHRGIFIRATKHHSELIHCIRRKAIIIFTFSNLYFLMSFLLWKGFWTELQLVRKALIFIHCFLEFCSTLLKVLYFTLNPE